MAGRLISHISRNSQASTSLQHVWFSVAQGSDVGKSVGTWNCMVTILWFWSAQVSPFPVSECTGVKVRAKGWPGWVWCCVSSAQLACQSRALMFEWWFMLRTGVHCCMCLLDPSKGSVQYHVKGVDQFASWLHLRGCKTLTKGLLPLRIWVMNIPYNRGGPA